MKMLPSYIRTKLPNGFHLSLSRGYATVSNPQTVIEKIVQKYAVDLPAGSKVKAGDYVMITPEHV